MKYDNISSIEIDGQGKLCVVPAIETFPYIYRAAMEVHWDAKKEYRKCSDSGTVCDDPRVAVGPGVLTEL